MVAVVSGNGLGLLGGSAGVLGSGGQTGTAGLGQAGEGAWINAKTGNLLLQRQDELLAGRGPDIGVVRTYNSQGGFDFDNGDSWQLSLYRKLASLTGTVNTANSTIKRFEADGSQLTYTYDATLGKYVNRDGSGAYDTLSYDSAGNTWTWRDGDSGLAETFEASPTAGEWRITSVADRDGNTLTYGYDTTSGLITSVQTANGETTLLQYNASRQLTRIDIVTAGNVTTTRVRYEYDSNSPSRLTKVITDLTPQDGSVADNNTFVTTYTYHGTTTRVASITHGDGTQLSFTYDASGRVQTYTDGSGAVTTLTYNSGNTTVTDALGQVTTLHYDSNGNLTRLQGPAGSGQNVQYAYNARGDVTQVTDSRGNVTQYSYDSQGNRIREQDAAGTVIERDYNASNQLVRQTVYAVADPDGVTGSQQATQPQTSHYIYDANQRLRFAVSPEGRVTEYRYDGYGQQNSVIQHAGTIDLASLATLNYSQDFNSDRTGIGPSTLPAGIAWSNGALAFTSTQQATSAWPNAYGSYFPLGTNWQFEVTTPATISAGLLSAGIASSSFGTASYRRHRAYFSNGRIYATSYTGATSHSNRDLGLAKPNTTYVVDVRTENSGGSTLYVYEKGTSPASGAVDRMWWPDWTQAQFSAETMHSAGSAGGTSAPGSTNTIVLDNLSVTTQAGLSTLETWSASQDQRGSQRTDYVYDARGLLRQTTGYALITAEGLGTIASNTYYVRDAAGRVLQSIDAWGMSALSSSSNADLLYQQDSAGRLTGVVFDKVTGQVKNVSARDTVVNHLTTYVHDGLGRLIYKALPSGLGQAGYAEQTLYDGANRRVTVVQSDGLRRVSAYDQRGLLVSQQEQNSAQAVLSGTSYQYDSLGRLRAVTDAVGGKSYYLYDSAGRQSGYIDAAGALTEFLYNANAQVTRSVRYASAVSASLGTLFAPDANQVIANVELSSVRPASTDNDQIARTIYDEAGRERFRVDARGFVVESRYDGAGRLTQTLAYARALTNVAGLAALGREARASDIALLDAAPAEGQIGIYRDPSNDRVTRRLYDGDGLLRGELDGVGYLTEYRYDALGRMTQYVRHAGLTDSAHRASGTLEQLLSSSALLSSAGNNLNQYFIYNSLGQLAGEIDAERYYTRHRYDANGNRVESTRYATRADVGRLTNAVTPVTVKLRLSGTAQGGVYPQVQVKIDGTVVGTITLNSTAAKDYTLSVSGFIPGRDHNVSLVYLNDTGVVGTEDRNLFLHSYNLTTPVVVQNASWGGVQVPGNTDLTIAVWSAADGLLPYGGETQTTNYSYTVRNQLASRLDADGTMNLFVYDALGRMVSSSTGWTLSNGRSGSLVATDVRGQQQRYDLQGRLTGELSALGVAALEALGASPTQAQIDAVWATYGTHHEYDAAGRRTRTTDANGNQTLYFYDAMGRITYSVRRVRNPANASEWVGEVSKREYNALGQLTRERQMATFISATKLATLTGGAQSQITAGGVPTETTNDRVLDYTYHLTGEVRSTKTYLDAATSQTQTVTNYYTGFGQLQSRYIQQVAGRSRQDQFGYDRRGLLTWNRQDAQWGDSTSGSGANANAYVISQGFNAFGHLASRIDARGVTERYGYDKLGRQIAVRTDPDDATGTPELNRLRQVAFDAFDRVIKQTDALGQITTYSYDTANRTVTVTTPEGIVTKTTRNRHGEVITLVDGLGNESRFEYDKNGNLVSEKRWDKTTGVETTVATHGYDTAGLLKLSETDANGNVVAYTYDAAGRMLTRRVDPTGLDLTTTYQYDAKGQAVKVTDANGNVTQTTFDRSGRVIEVAVDPTGLNLRTRYEYDLDGHVLTLTEGYGTSDARRTAYEYDNLGRRTKQVVDPDAAGYTGLKLTTTWTYDGNDNVVARIDGVGTPEVRTTRYTYDALNRLTDTIDALGGVTRNEYDLEGRIVRTTAYAQAINMATFGAPGTYTLPLVTALLNQTDPNNRVTLFAYDEDGRLRFVIDALGAVTERQYDAAGNLTAQVRYANALAGTLAANTLPQVVSSAASSGAWVVTSTADRKSSYSYDAFNRVATVIDAAGTVTRNVYDAAGNLTDSTIADGTPLASTVHRVYDKAGRVASETRAYGEAEASTTLYGYDALGNQTSIVEAFGTAAARTTIQEFDKAGRKTAAVDGAGARTTTTYNARGDIIKVTDALGNTGYFYTDALGRVTLQVDPEGAVTETRYDALGNVTETFRYANKVVGAVSETARPQILAAAGTGIYVVTSAADQRQQVFHDLLGRKSEIRTWYDSAYYSETFTYDVQGNVLTAKARNGAITTYAYDVLGRKTLETLPIESRNASNQSVAVKNSFAYDVLGNLVQKTEAVGLPEQRITTYAYDKLNRQVMETGQSFTTYDPISNTSSTATPVKQKLYDALGNLVEETDPRGRRTLHYYDAQGREIGRIDGAGTYTVWTYDAADNRIGQTVHANQVALSGSATLSNTSAPQLLSAPPLPGTNAVYVVLDSANDRSVAYTHDGAGRQTGTRIDNVTGGAYDPDVGGGTYQVSTGSISTTTVHDAMGNVVRSVDGNGNVTRSYFNKAGQQVGQLDANKYLTVWARDTAGNVIQETRYANAVAATLTVTDGTGLATLIGNVAASSDDRITLYVYDKLNRIVSQTQKNVAGGTVNTSNGVLAESTADAVTQYTYDGLNNVTRQIDASSAITDWTYDSMGRKRREQKSGYVDHLGVSVRPTTDTEYDGLNQVKREILRGTNDSLETDDRITVYTYVGGFLASVTDANGAVIQYGVDANGNVTKRTLKNRGNADNVLVDDVTTYHYDSLNRQVKSTDVSTSATQEMRYNAFGEITGKRTNNGGAQVAWPEFALYDRAGRAWMSTAGDGVTKVYLHDANGNATQTLASTTDLSGLSLAEVLARTDTLKTISVFDGRNQLTETFEVPFEVGQQLVAIAANTANQSVFVANGSAITIGPAATIQDTTPPTTPTPALSSVSTTGAPISVSVTGSNIPENVKDSPRYNQRVSATVTLPANLPGTGNIRAQLSVSRPTYYRHVDNSGEATRTSYSYSPTPDGKLDQVTAISAPAYSATSVVVAQGSAQISIAAQSARDAYIVGAQTYTLTLYQQTANGDVLIGTVSGTVNSSGTTYAATMTPPRRLAFNGQPTAATSLLMAYRTQGSTGPWTWLTIPRQKNTGGAAIPGSFALDWTSLAGGNYEYQYYAIDSSGAIVNQQTGNLNLTNTTAPGISQNTGALGGMGEAGRGLVSDNGKLNLYGLANNAASLTVSYRIKGSGGAWVTYSPVPTKHESLAGWFYLFYESTFQSNTTYELDIVAKDGSGNVVSRSRADFSRDGSGSPAISAFTAYNPQASIVTITTLTNTAYVEVAYRTVGDLDPTYSTVRVNPTAAGSGVFLWDASGLVTNVLTDADYELVIKSYDADGAMLGSNDVTLRLGPNATLIGIQTQNMPLTLRVTPPQANSASIRLGFRLKGSNDIYTEVAGTASGGEFRLSLAGIPLPASGSVDYEYVYDAFDANGALLGRNNGVFTLNPNSTVANRLDWVIGNVGSSTVTIHKQQRINAFGEVIQEIDGLGRVTDLSYNTLGKLIRKEDPQTDVTRANGFVQRARPTTRFVYDFSGRLIATIDPNGNTNTQVWLAGGQEDEVVLERHADTGLVTHKYDIFGDKRIDIDALGYQTEIAYDKLGQVVQIKRPQRAAGTPGNAGTTAIQAIDSYTYDAAGNRITHTNALGDTERTYFDSLGRVTRSKSFAGFSTTYAYTYANTIAGLGNKQVGGWQKTTTDAVGRSLIDKADIFGRVTWHQDLGGHTFNYTYNAAGWLINQVGSSGQNIQTDYYANGNIKSVWDKALGTYASYRYDAAGNRTFEGYVTLRNPSDANGGIKDYYQYADIEYDELNRLKRVRDPKADIRYEYDAAGNRRHVTSTYSDGVNGSIRTQDYWYVYDAMNRFTVTMGILSTGARGGSAADTSVSIVKGTTGVAISYDLGGQRRQAANGSDGTVEDYSYSAEGYLADVKINNVLKSRRTLDLAGRVTYYAEYAANGSTVNYYRNTTYDKDSRVLSQSGTDGTTTNTYYVDATDTTASQTGGGALARSVNVNGSTITSYYAYEYWDTAKEMAVTTQGWNAALKGNNAYWRPGYAYHTYDVNGHLAQAIDAGADGAVGNADDRTFRYINDAQGLTLMRDEIAGTHVNRIERYYYANGVRVGDVGNDGPSRTDYVQAIAGRKTDPRKYKNWEPVGSADFDQNYEPVSPSYPGPTPSSYTVRNGDTLQNIARSVWGDGSLWYLIADANGLSGNEILKAGATLTLPNKITNLHNNAGTFRPYNPGEVIGDTSPTLPAAPPPPRKKKCGGLAIIVVAVVAVVATVLTAGALAPAAVTSATAATGVTGLAATWASGMAVLGGAGFATGGLAAAAIGGAVGSVAGQLTGMALGVQDKFSWGAVATAALTTALAPKITPFDGKSGWAIAGNAAARSMVNQGINIVTGQQKGFSWAGVAASAIAAPVMHKVGNALFGESDPLGNRTEQWTKDSPLVAAAAESTVNALISATAHIAIVGGKVQWSAVAADSISGFIQSRALINAIQSGPSVQLPEVVATEAKTNPAVAALYRKTVDDFRAGGIDADKAQELALQGFDLRKSFDDKQALDAYKIDVLTASGVSANSAKRFLNDMGLITSQPPHALVPLSEGDSGDIVAPISLPPVTIEGERGAGFSVTGRFLFDWQNELAAVGTASQKLSQWIDGNPALGWALMAVQAATTPMLFAGQQALQHSPVGEMLNSITGAVFEDVTKFVDDEGVIGDRGKAALMTVGGISALSLTVGGISALRNSVSSVRSAFSTMRAKFARHERFDSIDAFVRATNDPAPKTLYSLGGVEWKTDGLGRFDVVEGPVNLNPVGRNDPLLQRRIGYTSPYDTDVGFHVWPDQWGGPTSMINVVPGNGKRTGDGQRNLNNGAYADFEREVTALVRQQGNNVQVRITAGYNEGNSSRRPDVFNLTYRVNGGEWELPTRLENKW
jgi:YD repeat-containing protein